MASTSLVLLAIQLVAGRAHAADASTRAQDAVFLRGSVSQEGQAAGTQLPAWCEFVPEAFKDAACRGSSGGCSCKDFCTDAVPATWQWNPECCGCHGSGNAREKGSNESHGQQWCDDIPAEQRAVVPACTSLGLADPRQIDSNLPSWCSSIPVAARINTLPCTDARHCSCSSLCSATPSTSWRYNPLCCGCHGMPEPPLTQDRLPSSAPTWCADIPVGTRDYAPACSGVGSCSCEEACSSIPSHLQRYSPACCGCSGSADVSHAKSSSASPGWCASVPAAARINVLPCADMGQCQCSSLCSASPQESWRYNPLCCACAAGAQDPEMTPPVAAPGIGASAPSWCGDVPNTQQHFVAACFSHGACQCSDSCKAAPAFTWRFNPLCCGCPASAEVVAGSREPSPAGPGCSCSSFCSLAPSAAWSYNPLCCGCAAASSPAPPSAPSPGHVGGGGGIGGIDGSATPPGLSCTCSGMCGWSPSGSWRYNPLCCGCSGSASR
mmetsp:Transcript_15301/g.38161  ORF Transcript_15301/g.38161 Transcript_15301/m.38161 type:complete len:495 (+) Transcript_15301:84-1568(+)